MIYDELWAEYHARRENYTRDAEQAPGRATRPIPYGDGTGRPTGRVWVDPLADVAAGGSPLVRWWAYFESAAMATWELYRRYGWLLLVDGPLPGHGVSGCEQTELAVVVRSRNDPAAVDGAAAGITYTLAQIVEERVAQGLVPRQAGPPPISGQLQLGG